MCVCMQVYTLIFGTSLRDGEGTQSLFQGAKVTTQKPGDKVRQLEVSSQIDMNSQPLFLQTKS